MTGELKQQHERFLVEAFDLAEDEAEYRVDAAKLMERTDLNADEFARTLRDLEEARYADGSTEAPGAYAGYFWLTMAGVCKAKELRAGSS